MSEIHTGLTGCSCQRCREEFETSMRGAARWELEELLEDPWSDPEARRAAFEAMGGCDE